MIRIRELRHCLLLGLLIMVSCGGDKEKSISENDENKSWEKVIPVWTKDANIYQLNTRQYTGEGGFRALLPHMDRLKKMGVDIVYLLPIHPIGEVNRKGTLGSFYSVKSFRSVNPEFGNLDDFKNLVSKAHALDMKIIIDWVAHSASLDNPYTKSRDWFKNPALIKEEYGAEEKMDRLALNFANEELRQTMIDDMLYWVKECDIDGFHCDDANRVPMEFWQEARKKIEEHKAIFLIGENVDEQSSDVFDMGYDDHSYNYYLKVAKQQKKASDLSRYIKDSLILGDENFYFMNYLSNYQENISSSINERMGSAQNSLFVLSTTLPGMPLIYSGQESSRNKRLKQFEKDSINWDSEEKMDFYKEILSLKKKHSALWNGNYGGKLIVHEIENPDVIYYSRESENDAIHIMVNLSNRPQQISADDLFISEWKKEKMVGTTITIDDFGTSMSMRAWAYAIFSDKD